MSLKHPRADNLILIRNFIFAIYEGIVTKLEDFKLIKPAWSRTRHYHYWSAIRDLGFAYLKKDTIVLTKLGKELALLVDPFTINSVENLRSPEIEVFKNAFEEYKPLQEFLTYFISNGESFSNFDHWLKYSGFIIMTLKDSHTGDAKKSAELKIPTGRTVPLNPSQVRSMLWSLKRWCKQIHILDEIYLESKTKFGINPSIPQRILFPIKIKLSEMSLERFKILLFYIIKKIVRESYIPIPTLSYHFCTKYYASLQDFHHKLTDLYKDDPFYYYLEISSLADFDKRTGIITGYSNYPQVDGYYRSHLILRNKEVLGEE